MLIDRQGDVEYLVAAPAEETGCGALWHGWLQCRHHLDGEHVGISGVRADGSVHVLKRWPIDLAPATHPRSAEEIAWKMVSLQFDPADDTWYGRLSDDSSHGAAILWPGTDRDRASANVDRAHRVLVSLIEQIRGSDAIISTSNGPLALDPPTIRGEPITIIGVSALDEPEDGYTHAVTYYGPSGIAGSALVTAEDAARIGDRGRAGQQPRDLAGRIRALIHVWAARWADNGDDGMLEAIRWLRGAREEAKRTGALSDAWTRTATLGGERWKYIRQAADELEVIVRECAPEAQ